MNKIKCESGHYFDGDRFSTCPICGAAPAAGSVSATPGAGEKFPDGYIGKTEILTDDEFMDSGDNRTIILSQEDEAPQAPQQPQQFQQPAVPQQPQYEGRAGGGFRHSTEMARYEGFDENAPKVQIDELAKTEAAPQEEDPTPSAPWEGQPQQPVMSQQPQYEGRAGGGFRHSTEMARYEGFDENAPKVQIDELAKTEAAPQEEDPTPSAPWERESQQSAASQQPQEQPQEGGPRWDDGLNTWVQDGQTVWDDRRNAWVQTPAFQWDAQQNQWLQGPAYLWNEQANTWVELSEDESQALAQSAAQQQTQQVQDVGQTTRPAAGEDEPSGHTPLEAAIHATGYDGVSAVSGAVNRVVTAPAQEAAPVQEAPVAVQEAPAPAAAPAADDGIPKTMSYYNFDDEPPVAWLVGVKGPCRGKTYPCTTGKNKIGRNADMDVNLSEDTSVTRALHAVILYEPTQRQFFLQAGTSDGLTYCNEKLVMDHVELKAYDKVKLGRAEFVFLPLCGEEFTWDDYTEE